MKTRFPTLFSNALFNPSALDRLLHEVANGAAKGQTSYPRWPALDVTESAEGFTARLELPGVSLEDVTVELADEQTLTIRGEKKSSHTEEKDGVLLSERRYGAFSRAVRFAEPVVADKITAELKDGVLTVFAARADEVKPRQIDIKG
ncbi:MAG: Hsp20/alpha crystallin family protein [Planctomycetota bacterium]|jgi:HSP20 family protein